LESDGSLWGMGDNASGELGNGANNPINWPGQLLAVHPFSTADLGIGAYAGLPVILFPGSGVSNTNFWLLTTTNLASGIWVPATNGIPFAGWQINNPPTPAFYRLW
jgi:hypothetical protein